MNLAPLLRQTVAWAQKTGTNSRSDATYATVVNLQARVVPKYRDIITPTGETTTTSQEVLTLAPVSIGDHLNGRQVIQVDGIVDYTGATNGYRALTR